MIQVIPIAICAYLCFKILPLILKSYKTTEPSSIERKACLITYIILGLPIAVYPLTIIADIMIFDSPGSEKNPTIWMIFTILVFYPLLLMLIMWGITKMLTHKKTKRT